MHTHLKGRIFQAAGTSFLVLQEDHESAEWVRVKELNAGRAVRSMRVDEIVARLPESVTSAASRATGAAGKG